MNRGRRCHSVCSGILWLWNIRLWLSLCPKNVVELGMNFHTFYYPKITVDTIVLLKLGNDLKSKQSHLLLIGVIKHAPLFSNRCMKFIFGLDWKGRISMRAEWEWKCLVEPILPYNMQQNRYTGNNRRNHEIRRNYRELTNWVRVLYLW